MSCRAEELLGGCSLLLIGDFGQLPPVMDLPLYTMASRTELSDFGSANYQMFDCAVVLDQVMRQAGEDADQKLFRDLLCRMRNGQSTLDDWHHLMRQTPSELGDTTPFDGALHLYPTTAAAAEYNINKLRASGEPIAMIKAIHAGPGASKASSDDAGGLESIVCIAHGARVMLTANLWVNVGLVNGAIGTVAAICYQDGQCPPDLPVAVTVNFDSYIGPTLPNGTVPITPLRRIWFATTQQCSRLQLPLKLAWAVTIHKAQGMTLIRVVIDVGKKEFSSGLMFVACSRVRHLTDLLFVPPFTFQRLASLSKSSRILERLLEDERLQRMSTQLHGTASTPTSEAGTTASLTYPQNEEMVGEAGAPATLPSSAAGLPPADTNNLPFANLPSSEACRCDSEVHITGIDHNADHFKYHPVDVEWQQRTCETLGLEYVAPNGITPGGPDVSLTPPITFRPIKGDGNCLFRALSFIITGSEEQHMPLRQAIIRHMRSIGQLLWETQIYPDEDYPHGMEEYIAKTRMEHAGAWGTQVEIIALAHLLNTPILTYAGTLGWNRYSPSTAYGFLNASQPDGNQMALYIRHSSDHYDVITSLSHSLGATSMH